MFREKIIGIDLGTTNSVMAVLEGSAVKVIPNQEGNHLTPSVVAFDRGGLLVGEAARRQAVLNPGRTVASLKRFLGRRHREVQEQKKQVRYTVAGATDDLVHVVIDGQRYLPEQIAALLLRKLRAAAEAYLGHTVRKAVITVPAYFNDAQRQATIDAAQIAGFDTEWEIEDPKTGKKSRQRMRIINEPTAAALAYGLGKMRNARVAVLHLGGGTFDVAILDIGDGVFEVKSVTGDTQLGGDDFDQELVDYLAEEFRRTEGVDLRSNQIAMQRLKEAAEQAKKDLSQATNAEVRLPYLAFAASGTKGLELTLTRARFEQLVHQLIERCREPVLRALADARYKPGDIDEVVLVGGMTRMPRVQQLVKEIFGKEGYIGMNPDEVVAVGAAIQGAELLLGPKSEVLLLDVTPLSLGMETLGGVMTRLIERNTTIPTRKTQTFSTTENDQSAVTVRVFQGEHEKANDNRLLGQFNLEGIPPAARGSPQIEVTFDIDANGILQVSARDKGTGKEQTIRIESSSGLSQSDVKRMRRAAEMQAEEERGQLARADARNEADQIAWSVEKELKEHGDQMSDSDKASIFSAVERVKQVARGDDVSAIRQAVSDLRTAAQAMAQHMQHGPAGGPSGAQPSGAGKGKKDAINAEFEIKK